MGNILRVKLRWGGFNGSPGYSIFHMKDFAAGDDQAPLAEDASTRVNAFADAINQWLPYNVTLQVINEVEMLEDSTGELQEVIGVPALPVHTGGGSVVDRWAAATGAVITWRTNGIRAGRRIRGRTFLIPLNSTAFDNNGTLHADSLGTFNAAATALGDHTSTPDLGVYARPTRTEVEPGVWETNPDGIWTATSSFSVPDMSAVLRSRRD